MDRIKNNGTKKFTKLPEPFRVRVVAVFRRDFAGVARLRVVVVFCFAIILYLEAAVGRRNYFDCQLQPATSYLP